MKLLIMIFLLVSVSLATAQTIDSLQYRKLSPAEMQEDLEIYVRLLRETHPGLFRYQTEEEFEESLTHIDSQLNQPMSFYNFYRLLAKLSADIRCAHTQVFPVQDVAGYLNRSWEIFPFFLYPIDERLFVLFSGSEDDLIKPGFELKSINGNSVSSIRETFSQYYFRDGNNESALRRFLQGGLFSMNYYLFVEQPSQFDLVFTNLEGEEQEITVPAMNYSQAEGNYVSNPVNKKMMSYYNKKAKSWDLEIHTEVPSTAYLKFAGFGASGVETEEEAAIVFQRFMDKAMKKLHKKEISNLIIELRGNTGGWDIMGKELFGYLMRENEPVSYYKYQTTVTKDSDFLRYSDMSAEQLEEAEKYLIPLENGNYKLDPAGNSTLSPQPPKENRFTGNVYILIDEQCASTCAEFTAIAKTNKTGILVGNESGGAIEGGNGGTFIHYTLPNSGIFSNTPLVRYQMAVPEMIPRGKGTIPDYVVLMSLEDVLTGRDAQKEFVFDLIRDRSR